MMTFGRAIMKESARAVLQMAMALMGIILISCLPNLFQGMSINVVQYADQVKALFTNLIDWRHLEYVDFLHPRPLFPQILFHYKQSMIVLGCSVVVTFFAALFFSYLTVSLPKKAIDIIKTVLSFLESLPDILVMILLQLAVVAIFKNTGLLIFNIASTGTDRSWFLPIVGLSFPAFFLFFRIMLHELEGELKKDYSLFAKAKGFNMWYILNLHVFRNVIFSLFHYLKNIIWFMLTSLIIIELIYNVNGIISFTIRYHTADVFAVTLILLYIPLFIVLKIYDTALPSVMKGDRSI